MLAPVDVGLPEATSFLTGHLGTPVAHVELVGEGAWSRCFGFTTEGHDLVVRFGRYVDDFEQDRRASAFASEALPVPQVTDVGWIGDVAFAISTRVRGVPLESLSTDQWIEVLPSFFGVLDALRAVDTSGTSGYGGWDGTGNADQPSWHEHLLAVNADTPERRTHGWRRRLEVDSPTGNAAFEAGYRRLAELVDACPADRHLVHADLINRNVLVADGRITGVFDWGCSVYGDFLYDLAWIDFWTPWYPALHAFDLRAEARAHYARIGLDVADFDARMRCYEIHIGLDHLAYNAYAGDAAELGRVTNRLQHFVE